MTKLVILILAAKAIEFFGGMMLTDRFSKKLEVIAEKEALKMKQRQ